MSFPLRERVYNLLTDLILCFMCNVKKTTFKKANVEINLHIVDSLPNKTTTNPVIRFQAVRSVQYVASAEATVEESVMKAAF